MTRIALACTAAALMAAGSASAGTSGTVFLAGTDNGFFTPFSNSNAGSVRYGDSGWFGSGSDAPVGLNRITLGLAVYGSSGAGSTDINFTLNDGDPSGLVFGSGATLYSTTITNVTLADSAAGVQFFDLVIDLPNVQTLGGYNNVGWSISLSNFSYSGQFGFQCASAFGQYVGYYTNNASYYDGQSWNLFSFGSGAYGVANFSATISTVPAPGALALLGVAALASRRRRRG